MTRSNNIISWASKKMNIFKDYLQKIGGEDRKGQRGGKKSLREGKQGNIREGIKGQMVCNTLLSLLLQQPLKLERGGGKTGKQKMRIKGRI